MTEEPRLVIALEYGPFLEDLKERIPWGHNVTVLDRLKSPDEIRSVLPTVEQLEQELGEKGWSPGETREPHGESAES